MATRRLWQLAILACCSLSLLRCGIAVPDIKEAWDTDKTDLQGGKIPGAAQIEFEIKKRVYCDLKKAVQNVNLYPVYAGSPNNVRLVATGAIPLDWAAQVSLSLQVDEASSLSPGVTLNTILPNVVRTFGLGAAGTVTTNQFRSIGFGGTLSSTATRIDKFNPQWSIAYLMIPDSQRSVCRAEDPFVASFGWTPASSSPFILESDLGIEDWLSGAILTDVFLHSVGGNGGAQKPDTISYEIKFIIVSSGNVTPTWKLVKVSANTAGTFFSTGRTRTHDLIVTIGPQDTRTLFAHLASQIGQAVSGGNQALPAVQSTLTNQP
jgi:hypothetical protein